MCQQHDGLERNLPDLQNYYNGCNQNLSCLIYLFSIGLFLYNQTQCCFSHSMPVIFEIIFLSYLVVNTHAFVLYLIDVIYKILSAIYSIKVKYGIKIIVKIRLEHVRWAGPKKFDPTMMTTILRKCSLLAVGCFVCGWRTFVHFPQWPFAPNGLRFCSSSSCKAVLADCGHVWRSIAQCLLAKMPSIFLGFGKRAALHNHFYSEMRLTNMSANALDECQF